MEIPSHGKCYFWRKVPTWDKKPNPSIFHWKGGLETIHSRRTQTELFSCWDWLPGRQRMKLTRSFPGWVDSIMLVEDGFSVTSVDASDKMLKYALKERWNRRKEEAFDKWVIEEANWLTLDKDVQKPGDGFDAVICLGNSFAHLPDFKGDQSDHKLALKNIASMVRPGGLMVIDHRNYDYILATGCAPPGKNIYYKSDLTKDITTSVLLVNNKAHMVTLDYTLQVPAQDAVSLLLRSSKFRLSYYPHCLEAFTELLKNAFQGQCQHSVLGDFQPYQPGQAYTPCYFIHVVKKTG
uniref:Glycine N-methyltransferase n=1 Tax=Terrapene triunguis TaxID=2587831 RepID=A0A674ICT9_9SAUR